MHRLNNRLRWSKHALLLVLLLVALAGCRCKDRLTIIIDGSGTVYPINEAIAEEFIKMRREAEHQNDVRITIGVSGTGGGFEKFCRGELDIAGASRPIKSNELERCAAAGVEFVEVPIAYDGIAVVVHPENDWAHDMTVSELKQIWEPEAQGQVMRWSDVRPTWPDRPLRLFGAGVDSGTYDYFTAAIVGREHASRGDFTSSEDDNVLVQGISRDINGLGFFGFAYFEENKEAIKAIAIDDENDEDFSGPILPSFETIADSSYQPLSRPVFIYIRRDRLDAPEMKAFLGFYMNQGRALMSEVGYVPLQDSSYALAIDRIERRIPGAMSGGKGSMIGVSIDDLMREVTEDE